MLRHSVIILKPLFLRQTNQNSKLIEPLNESSIFFEMLIEICNVRYYIKLQSIVNQKYSQFQQNIVF